jgi:hypothetical protein
MAGKTARGRALVSGVRVHPERDGGDEQREKGGSASLSRTMGRGSRACVRERKRGFCFFRERKREER